MKNDNKLMLLSPLWVPFLCLGVLVAITVWGLKEGFNFRKSMDNWFENSEVMAEKPGK